MFKHRFQGHKSALLVLGVLSLPIIGLGMAPLAAGSGADSDKLKSLLSERKALLGQAVDLAKQAYRAGQTDFNSVLDLEQELLQAELELAETREQRLELYRQRVENATALEKVAAKQFKTGRATQLEVLKAKSALLQSQIDLERAKSNHKAQ